MSKKRKPKLLDPPRKKKVGLSEDDRALWEKVAESVNPLKSRPTQSFLLERSANDQTFVKSEAEPSATRANDEGVPAVSPVRPNAFNRPSTHQQAEPASRPSGTRSTPGLAKFEHKKARRLRSGAIAIDARIDLHGMRQDEARLALKTFLFSSRARGCRWVLVITGKGTRHNLTNAGGHDMSPFDGTSGRERGVIRRRVPEWLGEADFRSVVVSYTGAAANHGGSGAIYVQLRSTKKNG